MTAIPKYPKYKDSGVEWLGEVPEHWELLPFLALFQISDEKNGKSIVGNMLSISGYRGVEEKRYESESQKRSEEQLGDYRVVRKGQLAVNTMWLNYAGLGVSDFEGHMSPAYRAYNISSRLRGRFAHHLLRSSGYVQGYTGLMQGIRPNSLQIKSEDFKRIPVVVPPLSEQDRIVAFLDEKTEQIDTLIAKKRRQIELLDEQKAILINRAVTRGLNPNAELKDSGIEWIGKIPKNWKLQQIRHLIRDGTSVTYGIVQAGPDYPGGVPYIRTSDMKGDELRHGEYLRTSPQIDRSYLRSKVKVDDLVVAIRATLGKALLVPEFLDAANLTQGTAKISPGPSLEPRFLFYTFNARHCQTGIDLVAKGTTFLEITLDSLRRLVIPVPPTTEQKAIISYLDELSVKFSQIAEAEKQQIQTLQILRSTLIAHAVTGQIRV